MGLRAANTNVPMDMNLLMAITHIGIQIVLFQKYGILKLSKGVKVSKNKYQNLALHCEIMSSETYISLYFQKILKIEHFIPEMNFICKAFFYSLVHINESKV